MGKCLVLLGVAPDVVRKRILVYGAFFLPWGHAGLDVKHLAAIVGILGIVENGSNREVVCTFTAVLGPYCGKINRDARAKVGAGFFNQAQEILEVVLVIAVGVAGHNHLTMPLDQFVHRQVREMSTIGKINVALILVTLGHQFRKEIAESGSGPGAPPLWRKA